MTSISPVDTKRTDVTAAIALLLVAEATLFFTFLFIIGPIATPTLLVPLVVVLALSAAWYWGQDRARWGLLVPVAFRVWRIVPVVAAAWGLGRTGTALFLTFIVLAELFAAFINFALRFDRNSLIGRHRINREEAFRMTGEAVQCHQLDPLINRIECSAVPTFQ